MTTCTKLYSDFPFAHRQHRHDGHCSFIHGHNWSFEITFAAKELDENGFVVDFGKLKWIKILFTSWFDHTLLLNASDPLLQHLFHVLGSDLIGTPRRERLADIRVVEDASCEGLARFVFGMLNTECERIYGGRVFVVRVRVLEDEKNSATYEKEGV